MVIIVVTQSLAAQQVRRGYENGRAVEPANASLED
jgi:hypothetical protein